MGILTVLIKLMNYAKSSKVTDILEKAYKWPLETEQMLWDRALTPLPHPSPSSTVDLLTPSLWLYFLARFNRGQSSSIKNNPTWEKRTLRNGMQFRRLRFECGRWRLTYFSFSSSIWSQWRSRHKNQWESLGCLFLRQGLASLHLSVLLPQPSQVQGLQASAMTVSSEF